LDDVGEPPDICVLPTGAAHRSDALLLGRIIATLLVVVVDNPPPLATRAARWHRPGCGSGSTAPSIATTAGLAIMGLAADDDRATGGEAVFSSAGPLTPRCR
ncbi:unnamed protein product, partial [Ectocarpus sp. 8 AP-2014]